MRKEIKQRYDELKKKYGDAVMEIGTKKNIKRTETGIIGLDYILGGGIPQKSAVEFWGREQSGKTTFSYKVIASFQKQNKICVYIDAENNFDERWAIDMGIDTENLLVINPETLEEAGDILVDLTLQNIDLVVIDSIVALIPEQELDRDLDEPQRSSQARVISPMTRKLNTALKKSNTSYIFINQIRENLSKYGSPYKTAGGRALKHFYRIRVEFKVGEFIKINPGKSKKTEEKIGQVVVVLANKNQTHIPYKKASIDFYYKDGKIDNIKNLIYACVKYNVIELKGSWYYYKKIKAQGEPKFKKYINDKLYEELKSKLSEQLRFGRNNEN